MDEKSKEKAEISLAQNFSRRFSKYLDESGITLTKLGEIMGMYPSTLVNFKKAQDDPNGEGVYKRILFALSELSKHSNKSIDWWITGKEFENGQLEHFKELLAKIRDDAQLPNNQERQIIKVFKSASEHHPDKAQLLLKIFELIAVENPDYSKIETVINLIDNDKLKAILINTLLK